MKTLSQSLEALAVRTKVLEDSATATFEANRAKLEQRRYEINESLNKDVIELDSAVRDAGVAGRAKWNDVRTSAKRPLAELRANIDDRKAEHEVKRAVHHADAAEEDATDAIELASYFLDVAEYAVIDAALARIAADDMSLAASSPTSGAGS
jgi:hypothetical protein